MQDLIDWQAAQNRGRSLRRRLLRSPRCQDCHDRLCSKASPQSEHPDDRAKNSLAVLSHRVVCLQARGGRLEQDEGHALNAAASAGSDVEVQTEPIWQQFGNNTGRATPMRLQ
jgi:hypothetical protein